MIVSADGLHYLRAACKMAVPSPYHRRWLPPLLLGPHPRRWIALTVISLVLTPGIAWMYFGAVGLAGWGRIFASALLTVLPGLWRASVMFPVLLDAPAFAISLGVAALAASGYPWLAAALSLPLGASRESAPMFAAIWAWSPWPLVGLLAAGWFRKAAPPPDDQPWLAHPVRAAIAIRREIGPSGSLYLLPWGGALAGLAAPILAHAQLLVAQDAVRLTVWAAPVLVVAATKVIPPAWWVLAVLATAIQRDERV